MKLLIKYPVTLLVLLLVGYTQVFAHAYRVDFAYTPAKKSSEQNHIQAPTAPITGIESIFFEEEENKRDDDNVSVVFLYTDLSVFYFRSLTSTSYFSEHFSAPLLFKSSLFRVLRL